MNPTVMRSLGLTSADQIREEIEYIAKRVHTECPSMGTLRIADSNYGMFEREQAPADSLIM